MKQGYVLLEKISNKETGIRYLWYEKKVDDALIKTLINLGFEALEHSDKQ